MSIYFVYREPLQRSRLVFVTVCAFIEAPSKAAAIRAADTHALLRPEQRMYYKTLKAVPALPGVIVRI